MMFETFREKYDFGGPPGQLVHPPDVVEFVRGRLGIEVDPIQAEILRSTAKRGILNCSRQWGKSTIIAAKAVHFAYTVPRSMIVVAAPGERQSGEFLLKAVGFLEMLGIGRRGDGVHGVSLVLPNRSRIVGLPATNYSVRGISAVSLLIFDEASQVPDFLYRALRPMLATSNGALWMLSTPYGRRGFFHNTWVHGGDLWKRFSVTGLECPRIPADFLEEERRVLGNVYFRQEYMCEFVDNGGALFELGVVENALRDDVEPLTL